MVTSGLLSVVQCKNGTEKPKLRLIQAHVVFRHGARAPYSDKIEHPSAVWEPSMMDQPSGVFPAKVQYRDENDWWTSAPSTSISHALRTRDPNAKPAWAPGPLPGGAEAAQLTSAGMFDAFNLGLRLKSRYQESLLEGQAIDEALEVRSTRVRRTCETASYVLGGLLERQDEPVECLLNADPEWMVFPDTRSDSCPCLSRIFSVGMSKDSPSKTKARVDEVLLILKLLSSSESICRSGPKPNADEAATFAFKRR